MKLPIQAQPINRSVSTMKDAGVGVYPQGVDCRAACTTCALGIPIASNIACGVAAGAGCQC